MHLCNVKQYLYYINPTQLHGVFETFTYVSLHFMPLFNDETAHVIDNYIQLDGFL